ncbi:MAG: hypothetical protein ACTSR8_14020 [Promethearchaeota archaeon]
MEQNRNYFKILAISGLILLFFSLFLDWYYFLIIDSEGNIIVQWNYNLLIGWRTPLDSDVNELFRPEELNIPFSIHIVFAVLIGCSAYFILMHPIEKSGDLEAQKYFVYLDVLLLLFNGFYIVIFPIMYLIPSELYVPFVIFIDNTIEVTFHYYIGPGYIIQIFGFVLLFPKVVFDYNTLMIYKTGKYTRENLVSELLDKSNIKINFDKLISEEEIYKKLGIPPNKVELHYKG